MQISITRRNAGLSESLKSYVEGRLDNLTRRHKIIDATVILDRQSQQYLVEMQLRVAHHALFSRNKSTNMRASIDACVGKLDKQLSKLKAKVGRKALRPSEAFLIERVTPGAPREERIEPIPFEVGPVLTFEQGDLVFEQPQQKTGT